jgi:hypothetical protein
VDDSTLFISRVIQHRHAVGQTVSEPFPVAFIAFCNNLRMVFAHLGIEQNAGTNSKFIEHTHNPEYADP